MRLPIILAIAASAFGVGCTLDTNGEGAYPPVGTGGTADGAVGGAGGSTPFDASAGSGGTGGTGGSGGTAGIGGAGGAGGSGVGGSGGTGPTGGNDGGIDAPDDVGPESPLDEDCKNGVDDNGDGLADCADPSCAAVVMCAPASQTGWSLPGYFKPRAPSDAAASCGDLTLAGTFYQGVDPGNQACTCLCDNASGGQCAGASATFYSNSTCNGAEIGLSGSAGACLSLPSSTFVPASLKASAGAPTSQGMCVAFADPQIEPAQWTQAGDLCAPGQPFGGCTPGFVCVPRAPSGFAPEACIESGSAPSCPPQFPVAQTWYTGLSDNRDCSPAGCTCGAASGGKCSGTIRIHSDPSCGATTTIRSFALDGSCVVTQLTAGQAGSVDFDLAGPQGGTCTAAGAGSITGSVSPVNPHTICCQAPVN